MSKFIVSWVPKRGKWPRDQKASGVFDSFDAALAFAKQDGGPANARSCTILREGEGINAGKFFLDFIVK